MKSEVQLKLMLLFAVTVLSGCVGGELADVAEVPEPIDVKVEDQDVDESADEIVASAVEALEDGDSYGFDMDTTLGFTTSMFGYSTSKHAEGVVDRSGREALVETEGLTETEMAEVVSDESHYYSTAYVDGDVTYLRRMDDGEEGEWRSEDVGFPDEGTADVDAAVLVEALEGANMSLVGATSLDGEDAVLVSAEDAAKVALEHLLRDLERHGEAERLREHGVDDVESFDEVQLYLWVDRESRKPLKVESYLSVNVGGGEDDEADGEDGGGAFDGSAVFHSETVFHGYEDDIMVEAPEDLER